MTEVLPPKRIRIVNQTGKPRDTTVYDADTGEVFPTAVEVLVRRDAITVTFVPHHPFENSDAAVHDPEYKGPRRFGVKVKTAIYYVRTLELESW